MLEGIDVSSWQQGKVDWAKVKASGIAFAFIKATEGVNYVNPHFKRDWQETKSKGIIRGAYHFFEPTLSAEEQVRHFISTVRVLDAGDLPPVLDLEGEKWTAVPAHLRMEMVLTWIYAVEKELGKKPILYLGFYFARDVLGTGHYRELSTYKLWIAHYTSARNPLVPPPWEHWTFWQFTDRGEVPGADSRVDKNRFAGSREDLLRLTIRSDYPQSGMNATGT